MPANDAKTTDNPPQQNTIIRASKRRFYLLCVVSLTSLIVLQLHISSFHGAFGRLFLSTKDIVLSSAYTLSTQSSVTAQATPNYAGVDDPPNLADKPGLKTILLWNPFFNKPHYGAGFGTSAFERTYCPVKCWITDDPNELPTAEAVVVHAYNMGTRFQNVTLPTRYSQKQIFAFFILESPLKSLGGFQDVTFSFRDVFNLTMSYLDAPETDIRIPIGSVIRKRGVGDGAKVPKLRQLYKKRKTGKMVVWFVSNCDVFSARNEYVKELSKYVEVDVYGECGTLSCPKYVTDCFKNISRDYMFYLSFENSYCKDYITEKAFRTLLYRMVPIVLGGGNYKKDLPKKSFIDVRDFTSPRTLARYLNHLKRNMEEYRKYFLWRAVYTIASEQWSKTLGFCQLCRILHNDTYIYKSNYDPLSYWDPERWCLQNDAERRVLHLL